MKALPTRKSKSFWQFSIMKGFCAPLNAHEKKGENLSDKNLFFFKRKREENLLFYKKDEKGAAKTIL